MAGRAALSMMSYLRHVHTHRARHLLRSLWRCTSSPITHMRARCSACGAARLSLLSWQTVMLTPVLGRQQSMLLPLISLL